MHDLIGQTLGQYRIIEQLGKGGMATVFKAFQPSLERYVAIKVLPPYFAHEEGFSERFVREARAIGRLEHPHILPIYDYGQDREVSYIAMKYVDAGTLKDMLSAGSIPLERAVKVIAQTAEALDYAHQEGVIHRDIKPANILMDRGNWVQLTDFGLAKMIEGSQQLTASGVGVGTPAYMAPEQGQGRVVDGRADIYSLGIVLYEMLTGGVPYEAETPLAVVLKHVTEPLKMPRLVNPTIPEAVELVILKALAKDPDDRYQTAGEMAEALQNAFQDSQLLGQTDAAWPSPADAAPVEAVVTIKASEAVLTAPEVLSEGSPASAATSGETPTEFVADVSPAAAAIPPKAEQEARPRPARRRIPWWAFAIAGVLVVALIGAGVWLAVEYFGGGIEPEETSVAGLPTAGPGEPTRPPTREPAGPPSGGGPGPSDVIRLGLPNRPDVDVRAGIADLEAFLSEQVAFPVEIVVFDDPMMLPGMFRDGAINASALTAPQFLWLVEEEGLPLEPILTLPPFMYGELYARDDGAVQEIAHLRRRPIAIVSWNDWSGILGLAALMDEGLNAREESEVVYLAPGFSLEMQARPLEALINGEVDAAIVGNGALDQAEEEMPGIGDKLVWLGETEEMAYGVVAVMPELPEDQVSKLHDAVADEDPELTRAISPYGQISSFDPPLLESFANAVHVLEIPLRNLVANVPPEPPPGRPPAETRDQLRVAVIPAPGTPADKDRFLAPILASVQGTGEEYGFEVAPVETPPDADPAEIARQHVDEGFNVIVAIAWPDPETLMALARDRPEATFLAFAFPPHDPLPNVAIFTYRMGEGGLLAGALAGRATESGVVGIVVGPHVPAVEQLAGGFEKGLAHACPDCRLIARELDSFTDREAGQEAGRSLVAEGANVVFNAAGGAGSAAIRAAAQEGAWVIGVDTDEWVTTFEAGRAPNARRLLGSIVLRLDTHVHKALAGLAEGRFEPGTHPLGMAEEGIEFVPSPETAHPRKDELRRYLDELIVAVREGRMRP